MVDDRFQATVALLRERLRTAPSDPALSKMLNAKSRVVQHYGAIFSSSGLETLRAEDYRSFLYLENNYHWSQLYRRGLEASEDLGSLRQGLAILVDESRNIEDRWNSTQIFGVGKAIKSAILLVTYPDSYGVWNNVSEQALERLGVMPVVSPKRNRGQRYAAINETLNRLASAVQTDLWTLDGLFWALDPHKSPLVTDQMKRLP